MPKKWSEKEKARKYNELSGLYVKENKTISEIASILGIAYQTVFQRMQRLGIKSTPERKATYIARKRSDIKIPKNHSATLAEFMGVMLGDGALSHYQVVITLGTKELTYAEYVVDLIQKTFGARPKIAFRKKIDTKDVYLGSVALTDWLRSEGLVYNKVVAQVDAPKWIFYRKAYMRRFLKGFFDTDGSIYKLRFGIQISFTNKSLPLLRSTRAMLLLLGYNPSIVSGDKLYITRREKVLKFFEEIKPANSKHLVRFRALM